MSVREDDVFLMLKPKTKQIFPLVGIALDATQKSKSNLKNSLDAYLINSAGQIQQIKSIKRLGFYGDSFISKVKSILFGVYSIEVKLESVNISFSDLIELVSEYVRKDLYSDDPVFEAASQKKEIVMESIMKADSMSKIFDLIQMPEASDCLDML